MPLIALAGIWLVVIGIVQAFRVDGPCALPALFVAVGSAMLARVAYVNRDRNKNKENVR